MLLSNSAKMREADNLAIASGISSIRLMEHASAQLALVAMRRCCGEKPVYVFCGSGNNGGDGFGAAEYLLQDGYKVCAILVGNEAAMTRDCAIMKERFSKLGGQVFAFESLSAAQRDEVKKASVIIDAIFGIGLSKTVTGKYLDAIELINSSNAQVVAADIPSGVAADTGCVLGSAVKANETVTFSMPKIGHYVEPGCAFCGDIEVVDITIPRDVLKNAVTDVFVMTKDNFSLKRRDKLSHKGDYGRLLIIAGSVGYTGAPLLCAKAAVRSGAGLVSLGVPSEIYDITAVKNDEAMPFPLCSTQDGKISFLAKAAIDERLAASDVCLAGPGMGRSEDTIKLVQEIVKGSTVPMVLDADALFALSCDMTVCKSAKAVLVLTPHDGEFARMGGDVSGGRIEGAKAFVREHNCILVLKGHRTICAFPNGEVFITAQGNPGMAKGGSGDVLAGILGAFACQMPIEQAVKAAVFLHSYTGDECAKDFGEYSLTATDIINKIAQVTKTFTK